MIGRREPTSIAIPMMVLMTASASSLPRCSVGRLADVGLVGRELVMSGLPVTRGQACTTWADHVRIVAETRRRLLDVGQEMLISMHRIGDWSNRRVTSTYSSMVEPTRWQ